MFFIEILSHASFFIIFLTVFYITFISYTQQQSMINDLTLLFRDSTQTLTVLFPSNVITFFEQVLAGTQTIVDPVLGEVSTSIDESNKKVLTPIIIYGFSIAGVGILLSMGLAGYYGHSMIELLYTNLISISIIAITEFIITTLYGQFRLLDNQYLSGLFALKASGGSPDCNVVGQTLDQIFPGMGLEKLI
jgi:hypothetical protein